jgi:hypothetical protein
VARRGRPDGPHAPLHCAERCFSSVTYPGYTLLLPVTYPRLSPPRAFPRPVDRRARLVFASVAEASPNRSFRPPITRERPCRLDGGVPVHCEARGLDTHSAFTTREAHAKWPPLPIGRGPRQPAASPNARAEVEGLLLGQSPIADARLATVRWRTLLPACNSLRSEALHCGTDAECDIRASRRHAGDGERSVSRGRGAAIAVMAGFHRGLIAEIP